MKYELVKSDFIQNGRGDTLYRIRALQEIPGRCKAGDLGGYISSEKNLSQEGNCWISYASMVTDNVLVSGDAMVSGSVLMVGNMLISGDARIYA